MPPLPPIEDRPGVTYAQAQAILRDKGLNRSLRTLQRWVKEEILTVKRITAATVILFRDEVEALVSPEDPLEQRMLSVKAAKSNRRNPVKNVP